MFCNWTFQIAVALIFPQFQSLLGSYSFLPFLIVLSLTWLILLFYLPETKNQSSSKMARLFQQPNSWYKPIGFQGSKLLMELDENEISIWLNVLNYTLSENINQNKLLQRSDLLRQICILLHSNSFFPNSYEYIYSWFYCSSMTATVASK